MVGLLSDLRDRAPALGEAVPVNGQNVYPKLNAAEGIYNGTPNGQDLARIQSVTGSAWEADDWTVWSFLAFDVSINLDFEMFTPSVLAQYAEQIVGKTHLLNHEWGDVRAARGTIIEAKLYRCDELPETLKGDVVNFAGSADVAKAHGGYYWVMVKAAVRANTPMAEGLADRSIDRCSIGAATYDGRMYCPDCSSDLNRFVSFWEEESYEVTDPETKEVEERTRFLCPHTPLTSFMLWLYSIFGDDDDPPMWSKGVLIDGALKAIELSSCVHGMIGGCKVIRE